MANLQFTAVTPTGIAFPYSTCLNEEGKFTKESILSEIRSDNRAREAKSFSRLYESVNFLPKKKRPTEEEFLNIIKELLDEDLVYLDYRFEFPTLRAIDDHNILILPK